jgi:hypothetical protein
MRIDSNLTCWRRARFLAAIFSALGLLASANAALADGKTIAVSGNSVPSECGAPKNADLAIELTGSLTGCWAIFVQHLTCRELNGFALTTELGREEFEGKLDGEQVTFDTQYTFTATWPAGSCPEPAPEKEIAGGCIHYIAGEDVGGLIRFYDVIPTVGKGATNFLYEGVITRG